MSVTAAEVEAHLSFLASDEMRGRNTGSPEIDIAANYIATQFKFIHRIADHLEILLLNIIAIRAGAFVSICDLVDTLTFFNHCSDTSLDRIDMS